MMIFNLIKIILAAFFSFLIVVSLVSDFFSKKTIENINYIFLSSRFKISANFPESLYDPIGVENSIVSRNIFNVTGEIPAEDFELSLDDLTSKNFYKVPCAPKSESLPVELLGIIYTGDPKTNLVTVQDPDIQGADVYHEGDPILDYNEYSVYRIVNSNTVEFRYGTKKICRSLPSADTTLTKELEQSSNSSDDSNAIVLTQEYVNAELGKGLSKIVNDVRIGPFMHNGKIEGFKIYSTTSALLKKVGLQNGDVVTQINNQKLDNPLKGVLIYETFQYEHKITFTIKRGAQTLTRKVIIK